MIKKLLLFSMVPLFFVSCGSSMDAVWRKGDYAVRRYNKIAVIGISKDLEARGRLEDAIIRDLRKEEPGINLVAGITLFPPNVDTSKLQPEEIEKVLHENNIDAVLTTAVVNSYTTQEQTTMNAAPYYYPYYYGIGSYYYGIYNDLYMSPVYTSAQNYVLQSNFFDLKEGNTKEDVLVWQGQSKVINPSSISSAASSYAKNLVGYLEKNVFGNR